MKTTRGKIEISVLFGLVIAILCSFFNFNNKCNEVRDNVLRLHIIANSDCVSDQQIKFKVRDAVLGGTKADFENCNDINSAVVTAKAQKDKINTIANNVLSENGYDYICKTDIKTEYFGTRVYDDFTLPAGNYNTVTIRLGNGSGHNWWCIVFPAVCVPSSSESDFRKNISKQGREIVLNGGKYVLKFKMAEIYESFLNEIKEKNKKN